MAIMDEWHEQLFEMIGRSRVSSSKAASVVSEPREWFHDKNGVIVSRPLSAESKAASTVVKSSNINKAKVIADFVFSNH